MNLYNAGCKEVFLPNLRNISNVIIFIISGERGREEEGRQVWERRSFVIWEIGVEEGQRIRGRERGTEERARFGEQRVEKERSWSSFKIRANSVTRGRKPPHERWWPGCGIWGVGCLMVLK